MSSERPPAIALCRFCGSTDLAPVLDLGAQPPAPPYPTASENAVIERWPLRTAVCRACWLMQLLEPAAAEPLADHIETIASTTMAAHADAFAAEVLTARPSADARIIEVASHGGHLAPRFAAKGARTIVLDPSPALEASARAAGFDADRLAFDPDWLEQLRDRRGPTDLFVDNYFLSHLRDPGGELEAMATLLGNEGRAVLEFDHVLPVLQGSQFDAIRHGHFSYLSATALVGQLDRYGLRALDATKQPVYGGAIRMWIGRAAANDTVSPRVASLLAEEAEAGIAGMALYEQFADEVGRVTAEIRAFLVEARWAGRLVVGYGAPSRGSTLLNACGITPELLPYTVDLSAAKQGRVMPGSGIPIESPGRIGRDRPAAVLVLTWDIADEIRDQLAEIAEWGGQFVVPIPRLTVLS